MNHRGRELKRSSLAKFIKVSNVKRCYIVGEWVDKKVDGCRWHDLIDACYRRCWWVAMFRFQWGNWWHPRFAFSFLAEEHSSKKGRIASQKGVHTPLPSCNHSSNSRCPFPDQSLHVNCHPFDRSIDTIHYDYSFFEFNPQVTRVSSAVQYHSPVLSFISSSRESVYQNYWTAHRIIPIESISKWQT